MWVYLGMVRSERRTRAQQSTKRKVYLWVDPRQMALSRSFSSSSLMLNGFAQPWQRWHHSSGVGSTVVAALK
jgi:hypothetical protein